MHRPERWGYLQFSTKTNGDSNYKPDSAQGIKDLLHQVLANNLIISFLDF